MFQTLGSNNRYGLLDGTNIATYAAAGSAQASATQITTQIANVSGADSTKGVALPRAVKGRQVYVYSNTATAGLKVYPASGDDINDGSQDAAITIEGKTGAWFIAMDNTTWAAIYTANT